MSTANSTSTPKESAQRLQYQLGVYSLVILCIISLAINVRVVLSVLWLHRPLKTILKISLSLAAADAYSSLTVAIGLIINSYLPTINLIKPYTHCPFLALEALRLGGIIITVVHLLLVAVNHYIGITRPLHVLFIMSKRITNTVLFLAWTIPIAFFFLYFALVENDGFQSNTCTYRFLGKMRFRSIFSSLFFGPFILIFIMYINIFVNVKRNQLSRDNYYSSTRQNTKLEHTSTSASRTSERSVKERIIRKYVKTLRMTTLILGSYVMGWTPAIVYFLLVCDDCIFAFNTFDKMTTFFVCVVTNVFLIGKTIVNPLIYSRRLKEIKIASAKMDRALRRAICRERETVQSGNMIRTKTTLV